MAKKRKKLKLAPKCEAIVLRPDCDPDTILERCKGKYESVLVLGYDKKGYAREDYTLNLTEPDLNFLVDQFKAWLFMPEGDDE